MTTSAFFDHLIFQATAAERAGFPHLAAALVAIAHKELDHQEADKLKDFADFLAVESAKQREIVESELAAMVRGSLSK